MACNCATTEQLNELYKKYGEKKAEKKSFGLRTRQFLHKIGVGFCMIFITPAIIVYVFYKMWGTDDHRINVMKFFNLKGKKAETYVG